MGLFAQSVPAGDENIPYLVTFGSSANTDWGDDDFSQVFFFSIPEDYTSPFYIRIFDPETGGAIDELKETANSETEFVVYGGSGCISEDDARSIDPEGNYDSGNLLDSRSFEAESEYDNAWFTFGPFSPLEGELMTEYGGRIFKVIASGTAGDDGNLYKYFLSTSATDNIEVPGGNAFTFEYSFRMHDDQTQVSHVYPYVDEAVISIKQSNFDYDDDGNMKIVSVARRGEYVERSGNGSWVSSEHIIIEKEQGTSLDIQLHKLQDAKIERNNVALYITNQYNEFLPFYVVPIGGVPVPEKQIMSEPKD